MADQKITALSGNTTPLTTDILPMVDDPGGTPATQKITIGNVLSLQTMTLLKSNNGTSTNASANNLDTIALTGLTVKDTLVVYCNAFDSAGNCNISLRNNTDSLDISGVVIPNNAGTGGMAQVNLMADSQSSTRVFSLALVQGGNQTVVTFTTAWTSSWTLALRSGGISGSGTLNWSWSVYKIAGQ